MTLSIIAAIFTAIGAGFLAEWAATHMPHVAAQMRPSAEANAA